MPQDGHLVTLKKHMIPNSSHMIQTRSFLRFVRECIHCFNCLSYFYYCKQCVMYNCTCMFAGNRYCPRTCQESVDTASKVLSGSASYSRTALCSEGGMDEYEERLALLRLLKEKWSCGSKVTLRTQSGKYCIISIFMLEPSVQIPTSCIARYTV